MSSDLTLEQYLNPGTQQDLYNDIVSFASASGFPVTNLNPGGPQETLFQTCAQVASLEQQLASIVTKQYLNPYSAGPALTILSDSTFDNQRVKATYTRGTFVMVNSFTSPYTVQARQMKVTNGTYGYFNEEPFFVAASGGVVTASFIAEAQGSQYNIATNSTLTAQAKYVGVSVANPTAPSSETWLLSAGTDEEIDERLRERNRRKWGLLMASETAKGRIEALAMNASSDIAFVNVNDAQPRGVGTVDVYLASATSTVGLATLNAVSGTIKDAFFGTTDRIHVMQAAELPVIVAGTVYHSPSLSSLEAQAAVEGALIDFISTIRIGGDDFSPGPSNVYSQGDVIATIENVSGVRKFDCLTPNTPNVIVGVNEKPSVAAGSFTGLTYVKMVR